MTDQDKEKISAELTQIQKDIYETKKEIIFLSKYRKAADALLTSLETLYNDEHAARHALNGDEEWAKNFE